MIYAIIFYIGAAVGWFCCAHITTSKLAEDEQAEAMRKMQERTKVVE